MAGRDADGAFEEGADALSNIAKRFTSIGIFCSLGAVKLLYWGGRVGALEMLEKGKMFVVLCATIL